jgi:predicted transcriptional regulator of viral defense system
MIRITNLEQTLLDTLHRPLSCGGTAVVLEAWERGLARVDEEQLAAYLREMQYLPTAQRLGYLLASMQYVPGLQLKAALDESLSQLDPHAPSQYQQLFPGMRFENLTHPWLVYVP